MSADEFRAYFEKLNELSGDEFESTLREGFGKYFIGGDPADKTLFVIGLTTTPKERRIPDDVLECMGDALSDEGEGVQHNICQALSVIGLRQDLPAKCIRDIAEVSLGSGEKFDQAPIHADMVLQQVSSRQPKTVRTVLEGLEEDKRERLEKKMTSAEKTRTMKKKI